MRPLLLFGVLYFVFTEIVRFGDGVKHYPVYLLSSIVLFTFFSETTSRGVTSLVERENLLRKIRFPRMVIPLVGRAARAVQPGAEPDRGVRVHLRVRHRARRSTGCRSRCSSLCWSCSRPA